MKQCNGKALKIIFAGTPTFAARALDAILAQQHDVVAVLTQPDRPAGRGMQLTASPVKIMAEQHGLVVLQPSTLKNIEVQQQLAEYQADIMVVAAYGLILPREILHLPSYGCLNIHASLLPRWRGAAPIQRAILAGDAVTGITIMQMDEGLDTGDILLKKPCAIESEDNAYTLLEKLTIMGAEAIIETLQALLKGSLKSIAQDSTQATYANKLSKNEAKLNWTQSAANLERSVRGYNPFPVAFTKINDTLIKVWRAGMSVDLDGEPGTVLKIDNHGIWVACGNGALCLEILQRPNSKAMPFKQFLQGCSIKAGDRFDLN